jgi:5-formyltetrahydrofolate cyclo-ligase
MLARQAAVPAPEQARASAAVVSRALALPVIAKARRVAVYRPVRGEIDPLGIARAVMARGGRVYLPVLEDGRMLVFASNLAASTP